MIEKYDSKWVSLATVSILGQPRQPSHELLRKLKPAVKLIKPDQLLWRVYFRGGNHPTSWSDFHYFGPLDGRFDHHQPDKTGNPHIQKRGIVYTADIGATCIAEVFQRTRVIDRFRKEPWLVSFNTKNSIKLLDLSGMFATQAGTSMALMTGSRTIARRWAQAFYSAYPNLQGIYYPSSMYGNKPAIALNERAVKAGLLPGQPSFHRALSDNIMLTVIRNTAREIGYRIV